jgi:hypothetical protein
LSWFRRGAALGHVAIDRAGRPAFQASVDIQRNEKKTAPSDAFSEP